jgi:hypothetical protein
MDGQARKTARWRPAGPHDSALFGKFWRIFRKTGLINTDDWTCHIIMSPLLRTLYLAAAFQASDILGWLFTLGLAGPVWQGMKHAQRAYRAQDKQDKLEEAAWAIGIPAISAGGYWFSIKIGIISPVWTLGNLPAW